MAKEKASSVVDEIRKSLKEPGNGGNMPAELLFIPKDGVKVVRFLSELDDDGITKVTMHGKWGKLMPQPCLKYYKKECPYHGDDYKTTKNYALTVFDYEMKIKKVFVTRATINSAMEDLVEIYDNNGTIKDRDVKLTRKGERQNTRYRAREVQGKPTKFVGEFKKAFGSEKIFAILAGLIREPKETEEEVEDEDDDGDED